MQRDRIEGWAKSAIQDGAAVPQVRIACRPKHTMKEGWMPGDMTIEVTTPVTAMPPDGFFRDLTLELHAEVQEACDTLNREKRLP